MAHEQGLVAGTSTNGWAQVIMERKDACGDCGASHCCTALESSAKMSVSALNRAEAKKGDLVSVSLSSISIIKSAALFYLIPLAGLISGVVVGANIHQVLSVSETAGALLFGFSGLVLGFIAVRIITGWISTDNRLTPVITDIIRSGLMTPEALLKEGEGGEKP
ncbi:MAG: SoxR reducing system RseC family protein [Pseudomonadota bacterium]